MAWADICAAELATWDVGPDVLHYIAWTNSGVRQSSAQTGAFLRRAKKMAPIPEVFALLWEKAGELSDGCSIQALV